jgi:hypothetical protein
MSSNSVNLKPIFDEPDNVNHPRIDVEFDPKCASQQRSTSFGDIDKANLKIRVKALLTECEIILNSTKALTEKYVSFKICNEH